MAAFPEADAVRDHARRIRAHTIGKLGHYLRQFETAVHARGGHVHWAETAEQAVAIVADIARQHAVRAAVKSKSMVSEEIDLNAALARAGVDVLETDLGEFIVQVDKDHPRTSSRRSSTRAGTTSRSPSAGSGRQTRTWSMCRR